jgi:hypothetical protein
MPFTFSHPAVVLPLNYFFRKRLSLTALIAGSIVPDFEYFVRIFHKSHYSHTWAGLFYLDLPAALLLCFLYHNILRAPLYANAPLLLKRKLAPFQRFDWNRQFAENWRTILACILLGALSHLLWDKVTHHTVPLVQSVSGIKNLVTPADRHMTYFLFWDISSLTGGFFLVYSFWLLPSVKGTKVKKGLHCYWLWLCGSALALFCTQVPSIRLNILDDVVIAIINSLLLAWLLVSVLFTIRLSADKKSNAAGSKKEGQRFRYP